MKLCKRCNTDQEGNFSKSRCTKDGLQIWCKSCMIDYGKDSEHKRKYNEERKKRRAAGYYSTVERPKRLQHRLDNVARYTWKAARERATKYKIDFSIDIRDIYVPKVCPILEIPIIPAIGKATDNSPSLDRINPLLGYIPGNVRVISRKANWMKSNASREELVLFCKNIFIYLNTKQWQK